MITATARGVSSEINVTPMIDILLVLLIIFMAITPVAPHGLEALLPRSPEGIARRENAVVLRILHMSAGQIAYKINETSITREELRGSLQSIFSTRATKVLFLEADKDVDFSPVGESIDIARSAGVDRIGLITPGSPKNR